MVKFRDHYLFIIITIIYLGLRVFASDPWTGATITNDTNSYVTTSKEMVFSKQFLSGDRPITLPLLYKLFTPPGGYDTSIRSEPSLGIIPGLQELPGFSQIAFVQSSISVFSWWVLALALYRRLKNNFIRYLGVLFILLSACLPEIVSWDHVMMAESLSYSLFVLILALSLMIFQKEFFTGEPVPSTRKWLHAGFILAFFFWVNTRDTNAYFLLVVFFYHSHWTSNQFFLQKMPDHPLVWHCPSRVSSSHLCISTIFSESQHSSCESIDKQLNSQYFSLSHPGEIHA